MWLLRSRLVCQRCFGWLLRAKDQVMVLCAKEPTRAHPPKSYLATLLLAQLERIPWIIKGVSRIWNLRRKKSQILAEKGHVIKRWSTDSLLPWHNTHQPTPCQFLLKISSYRKSLWSWWGGMGIWLKSFSLVPTPNDLILRLSKRSSSSPKDRTKPFSGEASNG